MGDRPSRPGRPSSHSPPGTTTGCQELALRAKSQPAGNRWQPTGRRRDERHGLPARLRSGARDGGLKRRRAGVRESAPCTTGLRSSERPPPRSFAKDREIQGGQRSNPERKSARGNEGVRPREPRPQSKAPADVAFSAAAKETPAHASPPRSRGAPPLSRRCRRRSRAGRHPCPGRRAGSRKSECARECGRCP